MIGRSEGSCEGDGSSGVFGKVAGDEGIIICGNEFTEER